MTDADVEGLDALEPDVLQLAESVSLAVRVEPALLRAARLRLCPHASTGAEADLWFSDVVDVRNRWGFAFLADARLALQNRLASRPDDLARAWDVLRLSPRAAPELMRFEEELTWLALSGAPDSTIANRLDTVIATMVRHEDRRRGLAQWALRAVPRLPARVQEFDQTWALAMAGSLQLGGRRIRPSTSPRDATSGWWPLALPSAVRRIPIGARLLQAGLELSEPPADPDGVISVPATNPVLLGFSGPGQEARTVVLDRNTRSVVNTRGGELRLRAVDGSEYTITSAEPPRPDPAPVRRIFLSYASPNAEAAARLADDWRKRGHEVFRFDDPRNHSENFVREIEREIPIADAFVVLMSPEYLTSLWCRQERRLAIQRENESSEQFVHVVEVSRTPRAEAEMLGTYSWLDATGELTDARLDQIAAALSLGHRTTAPDQSLPGFRDREDELAALLGGLRSTDKHEREMWVVVAPPLMGKTWLLARVEKVLSEASPAWSVHRLDVRREAAELRDDPAGLLTALLQVGAVAQDDLGERNLRAIARELQARPRSLLFILDSAELLTPQCDTAARAALTAVHEIVRRTGRRERFGLLIGTRRYAEWRGLGRDARTGRRFETLHLTSFGVEVFYQALLDLPRDMGVEERWSSATRLRRLTEGLPALLEGSVRWAESTSFLQMTDSDGPAAFDVVVRDHVERDLLSAESLLPLGAARPEPALAVLRGALRGLSTYRLYTQSHLTFLIDADGALRDGLDAAGWTIEDLWEALGETALESGGAAEIWHEIEPPLRRLLYRYFHRTGAERVAAQDAARRFYAGWSRDRAAGREQQLVLVECLWHSASRLMIEEPDAVAVRLPDVAVELARSVGVGPMYRPAEFRRAVARRLSDDDELRELLTGREGLFEAIVESVTSVFGDEQPPRT